MKVRIISVGKVQPQSLRGIEADYERRLKQWFSVEWQYLQQSSVQNAELSRQKESAQLEKLLRPNEITVLLDERGEQLTSPELALKLEGWLQSSKNVTIIIGGAYGVSAELRNKADFVWSLSTLVLPHQLVRTILVEQLYRAAAIRANLPYHHD